MEKVYGRFTLIISKKNDVYVKVDTEPNIARELSDFFTFEVPGARFMPTYKNRIWDEFGYISKILVDGGCNEWRTLNLINDTHQKLIDLYPNYVSWNGVRENVMGGTFKKIKIKWKKMYTDSQLAKLPMD